MRNTLAARLSATQRAVSTEAVSLAVSATNKRPVLSLEEEQVVLQEAADLESEITAGLATAQHGEDVHDNILDMADAMEPVESLTEAQAALIDTASELAVAGTDTDPDNIIPSMENFIGTKVSVEGWRETARDIWANIRKFVIEMWDKLMTFFSQFFSAIPRRLAMIKLLRDKIAEVKKEEHADQKEPKQTTISVLAGTTYISYPGHQVKDANELDKGLKDLLVLGKYVYDEYPKQVKKQGDIVVEELKKFDPNKAQETTAVARKRLVAANFNSVPKIPPTGFIGGFTLNLSRIDQRASADLSDAHVLQALRHTGVTIVPSRGNGQRLADSHRDFKTMTFQEMEATLKLVEDLIEQAESYENSSAYKDLTKVHQAMIAAGSEAESKIAKLPDPNAGGATERQFVIDVMGGLMKYHTSFVKWSSQLAMSYSRSQMFRTTHTALVLVQKSLMQYT